MFTPIFLIALKFQTDSDPHWIALARSAVIAEVRHSRVEPPRTHTIPKPVFVTIEREGKVLGCRGSLSLTASTMEDEIERAARAASSHDPRYRPLSNSDLKDFRVTVTVIDHLDPIDSVKGLRPMDGLVLRAGSRSGVVLPYEGKDPGLRLTWAYKKAGVTQGAAVQLFRMSAERNRG